MIFSKKQITKSLIRLRDYAQAGLRLCCSQSPGDMFSCVKALDYQQVLHEKFIIEMTELLNIH